MAKLVDLSGVTRFVGTIVGLPVSGIPQGGPLTADLDGGGRKITNLADPTAAQHADTRAAREAAVATRIPQSGPLTTVLRTDDWALQGDTVDAGSGGSLYAGNAPGGGDGGAVEVVAGGGDTGKSGGRAKLVGGSGNGAMLNGARVEAFPGTAVAHGRASVSTANSAGTAGQALVSDGASQLVYGGVSVAAGAPAGAPAGKLPFAFDTTAVTGGFYFWNGAAWVKVATIL